jgi:hypothetical protein
MSGMYRDRVFCSLSRAECVNTACDRYVDETVRRLADKAKLPIGWADLKTSKCGYVPREGER